MRSDFIPLSNAMHCKSLKTSFRTSRRSKIAMNFNTKLCYTMERRAQKGWLRSMPRRSKPPLRWCAVSRASSGTANRLHQYCCASDAKTGSARSTCVSVVSRSFRNPQFPLLSRNEKTSAERSRWRYLPRAAWKTFAFTDLCRMQDLRQPLH